MHQCKSPGLDGLPFLFYKITWLSNLLCCAQLLDHGIMTNDLNSRKIAPTNMKDLRPISLCIVYTKSVSKVLANRQKNLSERVAMISHLIFKGAS